MLQQVVNRDERKSSILPVLKSKSTTVPGHSAATERLLDMVIEEGGRIFVSEEVCIERSHVGSTPAQVCKIASTPDRTIINIAVAIALRMKGTKCPLYYVLYRVLPGGSVSNLRPG